MTTAHESLALSSEEPVKLVRTKLWARAELWIEWLGDQLNPILVKEARQALKSRQFVITFTLLLIAGWGWSFVGLALMTSASAYAPVGARMLIGYYWILALPLFVIVPFSAFRSLAAEREDGTYELLSITTLRPRQIVGGKLGSAVLQMLVYLSALSPCIAFTYLLRGIDIISIVVILAYSFFVSLLLSISGLFLATLTRNKQWQSLVSVGAVFGLGAVFMTAGNIVSYQLAYSGSVYENSYEYWITQGTIVSVGISYGVLFYFAAAAAISIVSENRSTKLRVIMLVQQMLIVGWTIWYWIYSTEKEVFVAGMTIGLLHWSVMGALLIGESPKLPERVARGLPRSGLARAFLGLLIPGPGSGYLFVTASMLGLLAAFSISAVVVVLAGGELEYPSGDEALFGAVALSYLVVYLGMGRLFAAVARRFTLVRPALTFLVVLLFVLLGSLGGYSLQLSLLHRSLHNDYTGLQLLNSFWTLAEIADGANSLHLVFTAISLGFIAVPILLINVLVSTVELRRRREEAPQRVVEDEIELHPEKAPKMLRSPWDDNVNNE